MGTFRSVVENSTVQKFIEIYKNVKVNVGKVAPRLFN